MGFTLRAVGLAGRMLPVVTGSLGRGRGTREVTCSIVAGSGEPGSIR